MIPDRILNIVNGLLVLVCLASIYYLATATYEPSPELAKAELLLEGGTVEPDPGVETGVETSMVPRPETLMAPMMSRPASQAYGNLSKALMQPLFTPTPTPTPPPPPPPAPPNLESAVAQWTISSIMDEQTVEFTDGTTQEAFTMTLNGQPRVGRDAEGKEVPVTLTGVDMMELKATLSFQEQRVVKTF